MRQTPAISLAAGLALAASAPMACAEARACIEGNRTIPDWINVSRAERASQGMGATPSK